MVGFKTYQEFLQVNAECERLGFRMGDPKHRYGEDFISLYPNGQEDLPVYSRDASLFTGNLSEVKQFLAGVRWARDYDKMLKVSSDSKRQRKEQDYRNRELANTLKK